MPSPQWPHKRTYSDELDSKGRVVVHSLEYTIIYQCTNRCRACNHFTFIQPQHSISIDEFRRDIEAVAKVAHCDKFSLIGGECLLHPNLIELLDIVNASGIADLVSLTSNAQIIDEYGDELWSRLQRIEFGLYGGKWDAERMRELLRTVDRWKIQAYFGLVGTHPEEVVDVVRQYASKRKDRWMWTTNNNFHPTLTRDAADEQEAQRRWAHCLYGHVCNTIDRGYIYRCPQSSFVPELLLGQDPHLDGLKVDGLTAEAFRRFVEREGHTSSCHRCCSLENYFPWSEVRPDMGKDEWLELAMGE